MINRAEFDNEEIELTNENTPQTVRILQIGNLLTSIATIVVLCFVLPAMHSDFLLQYRLWIVIIVGIGTPINFLMFENDIRKARGLRPLLTGNRGPKSNTKGKRKNSRW